MTNTMTTDQNQATPLAYWVFTLAALFYLYEFILQVSPSVMTAGIMRDFHVGAAGLGFIAAAYFYAYMPMQLPAGLLYDRFGPRALISLAIVICVIGTFFFAGTDSRLLAAIGRFLIGIGSAFSFVGVLVLTARWFPPTYYAVLVGIAQLLSSLGAILGEMPLAKLVHSFGWRPTLMAIAFVGLALAAVVWLFVRDYPPGHEPTAKHVAKQQNEWQRFKAVITQAQTWLIALYAFCVWAPIVVFAALWAVIYIQVVYQINAATASLAVSMAWLGIGVGSPLFGWWSERMQSRLIPLQVSALIGLVSTLAILYIPHTPMWLMYIFMFIFGVGSSGQVISFAVVKEINLPEHVGTASGFNNMAVVAGGALIQPLVGVLLHEFWLGDMARGIPIYHLAAYQKALLILPVCYFVALLISLFCLKETYGQHLTEELP